MRPPEAASGQEQLLAVGSSCDLQLIQGLFHREVIGGSLQTDDDYKGRSLDNSSDKKSWAPSRTVESLQIRLRKIQGTDELHIYIL